MKIRLIAVGTRAPGWVSDGFEEYARRLPRSNALIMTEIQPAPKNEGAAAAREREGERLLAQVGRNDMVIALDEHGESWTTRQFAGHLDAWRRNGRDVALLVGGADGLAEPCLRRADARWSLSALTFPHMLVRVIIAEQVYRAHSLLTNHPYHRD